MKVLFLLAWVVWLTDALPMTPRLGHLPSRSKSLHARIRHKFIVAPKPVLSSRSRVQTNVFNHEWFKKQEPEHSHGDDDEEPDRMKKSRIGPYEPGIIEPEQYLPLFEGEYMPNDKYNGDAPRYSEIIYTKELQLKNNGYFYAIDKLNNKTLPGIPGSLKLRDRTVPKERVEELQSIVYFGKDALQVCEALKTLLVMDGSTPVDSISVAELYRPQYHYYAAVIDANPNIGVHALNEPKYFRLNEGGIWSSKEGTEPVQKIPIPSFDPSDNARDYFQAAAFEEGQFCGFYKVGSNMKAFIEKPTKHVPIDFVSF